MEVFSYLMDVIKTTAEVQPWTVKESMDVCTPFKLDTTLD